MVGTEDLSGLITRLEKVALRLETATKAQTFSEDEEGVPKAIKAFDEILDGAFKIFLEKSGSVGDIVKEMGEKTNQAFRTQREFLQTALVTAKPEGNDLAKQLQPTADIINEIQTFREKNRRSDYFNHLSAISESIAALGWVTVEPAPGPFIQEMSNAGQFYTNRVLKDWKEKSKLHVEWVKAWIETLAELQAYIKEYHTTGLKWNQCSGAGGKPAAAKPNPAPTKPNPTPAKPPPPPPKQEPAPTQTSTENGSAANSSTPERPGRRGEDRAPVKKEPVIRQDGKKWLIEHVVNNPEVVINVEEVGQKVYIYKCEGSTIQIKGKCTSIVMDDCKKTGLLFESAVASFEFINCKSVQVQVTGQVPTISIDKTDGCQIFLSPESLNIVQLITAKSSEMNLMIPTGDEFVEVPVPEQFRTTIQGVGKLQTIPMENIM